MTRLTMPTPTGDHYCVEEQYIKKDKIGYYGEAIEKLARYENLYDSFLTKLSQTETEMESLRNEKKTESVRFRQLFANKMMLQSTLASFQVYGLHTPEEEI
ncbi:MAG: hypothetical protein ACOX3W_05880 [Christensenellaceae bacterium]|jgi:hypothetical protein